ncbi:MAG: helix-turn-helix domain-containing protein [Halodesulfurarchaeum sp.]
MSVIVVLNISSRAFELGRILSMESDASIVLETMVPMGERSVPFFRVSGERNSFEEIVRNHPAVNDVSVVSSHENDTLYALDWDISEDAFFDGVLSQGANVLDGRGVTDTWEFELRFSSHERLSRFQKHCIDNDIPIEVKGLYNPTKPDAGPWYGLTAPQREALTRAVEEGYYSIPRESSTKQLADEFDISDQAMTERLRRAIINLVSNTLLVHEQESIPQQ